MKLTQKLSLAFLLVSLIAIGLAAIFIWFNTSTQFNKFVVDQRQNEFVSIVTDYYQTYGGWPGVDATLRSRGLLPPVAEPNSLPPDPQPFVLIDSNNAVIIAGGEYKTGQKVKIGDLAKGISIKINSLIVGTVLTTGQVPIHNTIENQYLARVNYSLIIAAFGGALIALLLGFFIARGLTLPLRNLTAATRLMAHGELEQQVPVRSTDELGDLAESFNQMSTDLVRATLSRRQATADIAHDLRNPLMVIGGYIESLQDGTLLPTPERFAIMQNEVQHLQHLIEDLRTLSLADAGEMVLHHQKTVINELLESVAMSFRNQAAQQEIIIGVNTEAGLPEINIDPVRMEQVLGNLISNAMRYTPKGGEIHLSAKHSEGSVKIMVQDNGSGIPPEILPNIFERSYRGDPSRSGNESGLGLAIAKSIVKLHKGFMSVESSGPGKGAIFTIKLPVQ
jgi:two-component system sensor histidine kinase BaeS